MSSCMYMAPHMCIVTKQHEQEMSCRPPCGCHDFRGCRDYPWMSWSATQDMSPKTRRGMSRPPQCPREVAMSADNRNLPWIIAGDESPVAMSAGGRNVRG
jgi:hypothetical protein